MLQITHSSRMLKNSFVFNESRLQDVLFAWQWEWVPLNTLCIYNALECVPAGLSGDSTTYKPQAYLWFFDSISADLLRVVVSWLYITSYQLLENHLRAYTDLWWSYDSPGVSGAYYCTTQIHMLGNCFWRYGISLRNGGLTFFSSNSLVSIRNIIDY